MSCEPTGVLPISVPIAAESPQPLPLTTSNSSRCTSPMSPPSDQNASASSNEDESMSGINLTINKSNSSGSTKHTSTVSKRPSHMNHHINMNMSNNDLVDSLNRHSHKMKISSDFAPSSVNQTSRGKPSKMTHPVSDNNFLNINSPDFTQLLLEYRQVLLDVLTKSILLNDNDETNNESIHKGIILPIKCQCGYTSELSKQITRTSTYVHQLELKFRSLLESMKVSTDTNRYTPKRPWFINSPVPVPYPLASSKVSLLEKKKISRSATEKPISLFSGNSSINSSLNDDDEDIDSDEDDVNEDNVSGNLVNNHAFPNGSIEDTNVGGKTILEGYLESMKNIPSEEGSDEDQGKDQAEDEDDVDGSIGEEDIYRGPGKRIDIKTKKIVVQMQRNGASFTDISRQIGISRKSVRRIISNYKAYGLLEKKRESRIQKGMQDLILRLYSQGRSYTQISRATTVSKPTISKIIKQYIDSNIFAKGPTNGLNTAMAVNGTINGGLQDSYNDAVDDDMDEEREMIVDENAGEDEDEQDLDDDENHRHTQNEMPAKNEMEPNLINSFALYPKVHPQHPPVSKSKRNLSLIQQGPYNGVGYSQVKQSQYQQSTSNPNSNHNSQLFNNRLSLIKPQERYKPYDLKVRHSNSSNDSLTPPVQHRISKSHPIVPPLPTSTNIYPVQARSQVKIYNANNNGNSNNSNNSTNNNPSNNNDRESAVVRHKNKMMNRHSVDMSFKESLIVPEADKNNNTTLSNCNVTITSTSNNLNISNGKPNPTEQTNANLPPIPASLVDGSSDSEANLVPKNFIEGFPAGIMNSLNPNRATKLTLEDFNIVWQLRSQHWTHNQIRKYFQQRGKSISKSSISRIMNGKQRNFQQFFNVVPSNSNF